MERKNIESSFHLQTKTLVFRFMIIALLSFAIWPQQGCTTGKKYTAKVHKPKKRCRPYDHQKNRGAKRLKTVKMKN